jgi:hypothetical protein
MAVEYFRFLLRGSGGKEPTGMRFFELLGWEPNSGFGAYPSDSAWKAALIELFTIRIEECQAGSERYEEFASRIDAGLKRAAEWLSARPQGVFDEWRASGKNADVFIGGWMNSDQFDLTLPPEFLLACGRAGLPIEICTND